MDFQIKRHNAPPLQVNKFVNGLIGHTTNGIADSRPHVPESELPGGQNWVVQKFGGTSVGKFPIKIAEEVVL